MKVWAYVALAVILIAGITAGTRAIYAAGYNARDQQVQQEIIDAQVAAKKESDERWAASVVAATEAIRVEERIVTEIQRVEIEVPKIIERIVEHTPECKYLGPGYAGLLNDQVRAGNGVSIASPTDPPDG